MATKKDIEEGEEEKDTAELLQDFISDERLHFEGDSGLKSLNKVAEAIGYNGHSYAFGSPLEEFLSDNPGAQEALIEWIGKTNAPTWREFLTVEDEEESVGEDDK